MQYNTHWLLLVTQLYLYAAAWFLSQTQFKGHGSLLRQNTLSAFCMATGLLLPALLQHDLMLATLPYATMSGLLIAGFLYGNNANRVFFGLKPWRHWHLWLLSFSAGGVVLLMGLSPATAAFRISLLNSLLALITLQGLWKMHHIALREFPGWPTWLLHQPLMLFSVYLLGSSMARLLVGDEGLPEVTVISKLNITQTVFYMVMAAFFNMMSIVRIGTRLTRQLHMLSHRDPLTGLLNRRSLTRSFINNPQHYRQPLCVIFVDIDHFKHINDNFGHDIGDEILQLVGSELQGYCNERFRAYRLGGEEFCMVLLDSSLPEGLTLAESLRQRLAQKVLAFDGRPLHLTASFGVACANLAQMKMASLMSAADEALYKAKHCGRNRVEAAVLPVSLA